MGFSSGLRAAAFYAGIALLAVLLLWWVSRPEGLHVTRAEVLVENSEGYPPPPRTVDPAGISGQWHAVGLPYALQPNVMPGAGDAAMLPTSTTWYRVRFDPAHPVPRGAYLYIPRWKTDGEIAIYIDGRLFYQSHANLQWNGSNRPLWLPLENAAETTPPRELLVRIRHVRGMGGAISSMWIGTHEQLGISHMVRSFFQAELPYISSGMFLATGIFAFFVWLRRRRETLYLLFTAVTVATFLRVMHTYMGMDRLPISDAWFGWLTVNSVGWMLLLIHLFLQRIHQWPQRWLTVAASTICAVLALITLPLFEGTFDATVASTLIYMITAVMALAICVTGLILSWRARTQEGLLLAGFGMAGIVAGIYDMMLQSNLVNIEGVFLVTYAQIGMIIAFCHFMLTRYTRAMSAVEQANVVLARRLEEREAELNASHHKLREIERREVLHEERRRLMQDMHDGLGSSLVSALRVVEHGRLDEVQIGEVLRGCIDDLKLTIDSMEPVETDLLLLLGTLRFRLQPRLESTGIRLRWEVQDVPPIKWLDQRHSLHILRILQEAFTNVIKHAGASEVRVSTHTEERHIRIRVADNGRGFDLAVLAGAGRGLGNQRRRAEVIGGLIALESTPAGTSFDLLLPR